MYNNAKGKVHNGRKTERFPQVGWKPRTVKVQDRKGQTDSSQEAGDQPICAERRRTIVCTLRQGAGVARFEQV